MPLFFADFPKYLFARIDLKREDFMKKLILIVLLSLGFLPALATNKPSAPKVKVSPSEYSLQIKITDIPKNQQTLFVPIKIDTMILDLDKVVLEGLSTQNILAVASSSKDKVGPGIGLIKFDDNGLPPTIELRVLLKPIGNGQTSVSLLMVADEAALLAKGEVINEAVTVSIKGSNEVDITEKTEKNKKKLTISQNKLALGITRTTQQEETVFIPLIFDKNLVDIDETFGHAILAPGVAAKTFSSSSINNEGGPGVEIILSADAPKDFTVDIDLIPRGLGKAKLTTALPQKGHTLIVRGPVVNINPASISVASSDKK